MERRNSKGFINSKNKTSVFGWVHLRQQDQRSSPHGMCELVSTHSRWVCVFFCSFGVGSVGSFLPGLEVCSLDWSLD